MPSGAIFTTVTGYGMISGVFDWVPSPIISQGNYTIAFKVSDGHGGTSNAYVTVRLQTVSRASGLPISSPLKYVLIAGLGAIAVVVGERLWKLRKTRLSLVNASAT
jgi:hypothetical protein